MNNNKIINEYIYPLNLFYAATNTHERFPDKEETEALEYALKKLTDRELKCVQMRFEYKKTYKEIGDSFDVSRERARQIEAKALRKIRWWYGRGNKVVMIDDKTPTDKIEMSIRLYNALRRAGIKCLSDLSGMYKDDIKKIRGIGNKNYLELQQLCKRIGVNI